VTIDLEVEQAASRHLSRDVGYLVRGIRVRRHEIRVAGPGQLRYDIVGEPRAPRARHEPGRAAYQHEAIEPPVHRAREKEPPIDRPKWSDRRARLVRWVDA
jgi:hypothetical protein